MENLKNIITELIELNDFSNIELADNLGLDYEETTTGSNGYPRNLKHVITADTMSELIELKEKITELGYQVEELELYKKNGWSLWNRSNDYLRLGRWSTGNDTDTFLSFDMTNSDNVKNELWDLVYGDDVDWEYIEKTKEEAKEHVEELFSELSSYTNQNITVFFNPDNDYSISYIVSDEDTGYHYDSQSWKSAIFVSV